MLDVEHNRPSCSVTEAGYHAAMGLVDWPKDTADRAKATAHLLNHPAELTTAGLKAKERAEQAAKNAAATLKDPNKPQQAAHDALDRIVDAAHAKWKATVNWYNLPTQKKMDSADEQGAKGALDVGTTVVLSAVIPGGGTGGQRCRRA